MNLKYNLDQLLPDELEKLVLFINNLFDNKVKERLTNQEYQKNNLEIKCPSYGLTFLKKMVIKMEHKDIYVKIVINRFL